MLRIASCPCVDGYQLGPPGLGWYAVGEPRPSRREHYWVAIPRKNCRRP